MTAQRLSGVDGSPVTCDGCGAPVEAVTEAMKHPVPAESGYGPGVIYIVCGPMPDGSQPCLDKARAHDAGGGGCGCPTCGSTGRGQPVPSAEL